MEEKVETKNQTTLDCVPGNPELSGAEVLLGRLPGDTRVRE